MPTSQYYKHIDIGTAGYQYVNEFRPYLARDIYKHYCNDNSRILNQCAGWGGRLIGIASCMFTNIEYWETDPSTKTYKGLTELKKFLCLGDNYKQFNKPFEELELPKTTLTSHLPVHRILILKFIQKITMSLICIMDMRNG